MEKQEKKVKAERAQKSKSNIQPVDKSTGDFPIKSKMNSLKKSDKKVL